jgi:pyruvate dehydrogenase E2 component (dihydrolipoamide acetyltransferase)
MNGYWIDGCFQPQPEVHLGVAVSLRGGGLLAPAIPNADQGSIDELMVRLRDLVAHARSGSLRSSEMSPPTLTVTNLGEEGVECVFPVIYPPRVAMVGFGNITPRPWAVQGLIGVRPLLTASLAADHRVSDGHRGARFLNLIDRLLQEPHTL